MEWGSAWIPKSPGSAEMLRDVTRLQERGTIVLLNEFLQSITFREQISSIHRCTGFRAASAPQSPEVAIYLSFAYIFPSY